MSVGAPPVPRRSKRRGWLGRRGGAEGALRSSRIDVHPEQDQEPHTMSTTKSLLLLVLTACGGAGGGSGAVSLGRASDFAVLAKSGVSTVPTSTITGDVGVSPAAATFITGFSLTMDTTNVFATSPQVTGKVFASDYTPPTPSNLTTAISDMETAFTDAAGRAAGTTELGAGNVGGMTLTPGVYKWGTGLLIPTDLTLRGSATDVWIFQIAQDLTMSSGVKVVLAGGALPKN